MRLSLVITLCLVIGQGCASNSKRLGHGFRLSHATEDLRDVPGAWEGFSHHNVLFCRSLRLGVVGQYSISPSGRFALFEENGKLLLFDASHGQMRDVTDGSFAVPKAFSWLESNGIVEVAYYEKHDLSTIPLPE